MVARFDVETPTRLRKEVEDLTANMQALVNLTPTQLKATASRRYSTCRGSNRYITHNQGLKRVHYTKPWPQTGTLHKAMISITFSVIPGHWKAPLPRTRWQVARRRFGWRRCGEISSPPPYTERSHRIADIAWFKVQVDCINV